MRVLCLVLAIVSAAIVAAQPQEVSAASRAYHAARQQITKPAYGLAKVQALLKRVKEDADYNKRLDDKTFAALSVKERFTYTMIHAEDYQQNCDEFIAVEDEEKKIMGWFPSFGDETVWSERQRSFLRENRPKVIGLIRETMRVQGKVGCNLKQAIVELDAWELVPDLVAVFQKTKKDMDVLACLNLLMKQGAYEPFLLSQTFKKLYGEDSNYMAFLVANAANQKLVIDRATAYHKAKRG